MENKKFNIFALCLIVVMAVFSIYMGINNNKAKDGRDGLSAYELAVSNGEFSGTELEYLQSLHGQNGSNITLEDVYKAYLKEKNLTSEQFTYSQFILNFYPDEILDADETATLVQTSTASALRSTVDICYSFYLDNPIIYVEEGEDKDGNEIYIINESADYYNKYTAIGVSAGSGVIYKIEGSDTPSTSDDVAYIITNYHVLYADNFVSDESKYRVYFNASKNEYFTASYDESKQQSGVQNVYIETPWGQQLAGTQNIHYFEKTDVEKAPIETHFLSSYGVYLYGYQSAEYELSASFVGGSADNDVAVLKVERTKSKNNERLFDGNYKSADLGDSKEIDEGQNVIAVGNPLLANTSNVNDKSGAEVYVNGLKQSYVDALCLTSTEGVVSTTSEYCDFTSLLDSTKAINMRLMRVSAAINSGNSGGGLYDIYGRLVGIVNGKIVSEAYDNVGFAIPINVASRLADKIIGECDGTETQVSALKATVSSLGFAVKNGESNYEYDSNTLTWNRSQNVIIKESSASAATSGLVVDGIISAISFDDEQTKHYISADYDLNDILLFAKKGTTQKIVVYVSTTSNPTPVGVEIAITDSMWQVIN